MDSQYKPNYSLIKLLEKNIADEAEAREGYYSIFERYFNELSLAEILNIEEIIAEELKHSEILRKMIKERTGIKEEEL